MTDPTPATVAVPVELLNPTDASMALHDMGGLAQDAGEVLTNFAGEMIAKRDEAEMEAAALRKVIEDAPHEGWCMTGAGGIHARLQGLAAECDCWKSKALTNEEDR